MDGVDVTRDTIWFGSQHGIVYVHSVPGIILWFVILARANMFFRKGKLNRQATGAGSPSRLGRDINIDG